MLKPRPYARKREEGGLALVLVAMSLVVMLVFASFAIDLGAVYNARRQDQSAADAGSLAGVQEFLTDSDTLINQVQMRANRTLGLPDGTLNMNNCAGDSGALPTVLQNSSGQQFNCITRQNRLLRVRIPADPARRVPSVFGQIIGRDSYDHTAFAIAGLGRQGFGGVLPFSIFTGDYGHICLRTDNPSSPVSPCSGPGTGDSGILNFTQFGDTQLGTTMSCNGNGTGPNGRIIQNAALGADHFLELRPGTGAGGGPPPAASPLIDQTKCPNQALYVNDPAGADTITGVGNPEGLTTGLWSGSVADINAGGQPARLRQVAAVSYGQRLVVDGREVDSTPLWSFIADAADTTEIPDQCERTQFEAVVGGSLAGLPLEIRNHLSPMTVEVRLEKMLERCFELYVDGTWNDLGAISITETRTGCTPAAPNPCTGTLFGRNSTVDSPEIYDIQLTPRFGYVPRAWEAIGANTITFQAFVPIYIQRLCLGNQSCNSGTFSPGVPFLGAGSDNVAAVSAFAFLGSMLPGQLGSADAPFRINVNLFVSLIR